MKTPMYTDVKCKSELVYMYSILKHFTGTKESVAFQKSSTSTGLVWDINMAAV